METIPRPLVRTIYEYAITMTAFASEAIIYEHNIHHIQISFPESTTGQLKRWQNNLSVLKILIQLVVVNLQRRLIDCYRFYSCKICAQNSAHFDQKSGNDFLILNFLSRNWVLHTRSYHLVGNFINLNFSKNHTNLLIILGLFFMNLYGSLPRFHIFLLFKYEYVPIHLADVKMIFILFL